MRILLILLSVAVAAAHPIPDSTEHHALANSRRVSQYGKYGKDFFYYQPNSSTSVVVDDGVKLSKWDGKHTQPVDLTLAQPFITKLEFPAGKSYPQQEYWLRDDTSYVVISGNATFGGKTTNATGLEPNVKVHGYGDVFWVMAGIPHGPITNVGEGPLVVLAVGMPFQPQFAAMPSWFNPSVDWYLYTNRSYLRLDLEGTDQGWSANPSPHTAECMKNGGVWNLNFGAVSNTMPVLRVKWAPNCSIPFHYHPTGAMYFILYGKMFYAGDFVEGDQAFNPGDSRWVRPGFAYGPEYNGNEPMEITVFGTDTPPEFSDPPEGPYKVQKQYRMTHVFDHQPAIIPHNKSEL